MILMSSNFRFPWRLVSRNTIFWSPNWCVHCSSSNPRVRCRSKARGGDGGSKVISNFTVPPAEPIPNSLTELTKASKHTLSALVSPCAPSSSSIISPPSRCCTRSRSSSTSIPALKDASPVFSARDESQSDACRANSLLWRQT